MDSTAHEESPHISRRKRLGRLLLIIGAVLSVAIIPLICTGRFEPGVRGEWRWLYVPTGRWAEIWSPLLALCVFLGLVYVCRQAWHSLPRSRTLVAITLCALTFGHLILQMNVAYLGKLGLRDFAAVTMCPWSNGYFFEARRVQSPKQLLRRYPAVMDDLGDHSRTHPPGAILGFWMLNRWAAARPHLVVRALDALSDTSFDPRPAVAKLEEALRVRVPEFSFSDAETFSGWLGSVLMVGAYSLSVIPVYFLAKLLHGRETALLAVALVCVLPSPLFFAPCLDASYTLIVLTGVSLYCWGEEQRRRSLLVAAGGVTGLGMVMTLGVAPVFGVVLFYSLLRGSRPRDSARGMKRLLSATAAAARPFGWFLVGVLGMFVLLWAATGLNMFAVTAKLLALAPQSARDQFCDKQSTMTYWKWIFWNLANFSIFIGLPLSVLYLGGLVVDARGGRLVRLSNAAGCFHLGFLATLLLLNFSGVTLGEVARLWIPYAPFVMIRAAADARRLGLGRSRLLFALIVLQCAHAMAFKLSFSWV